jgi:hypothetical protein
LWGIGTRGLEMEHCGLGLAPNHKSPIHNPQSPIPNVNQNNKYKIFLTLYLEY